MMYLMTPGVGSMSSAALTSSESRAGLTGSPFRNLGKGRHACAVSPLMGRMQGTQTQETGRGVTAVE